MTLARGTIIIISLHPFLNDMMKKAVLTIIVYVHCYYKQKARNATILPLAE